MLVHMTSYCIISISVNDQRNSVYVCEFSLQLMNAIRCNPTFPRISGSPLVFYNKRPIDFANLDWFVEFLFCHKIKYVNLGLLIWLVNFDIVDTLLQLIERYSDSLSKSMLLII